MTTDTPTPRTDPTMTYYVETEIHRPSNLPLVRVRTTDRTIASFYGGDAKQNAQAFADLLNGKAGVPIEQIEAMYNAVMAYLSGRGAAWYENDLWKAMLAAAPQQETAKIEFAQQASQSNITASGERPTTDDPAVADTLEAEITQFERDWWTGSAPKFGSPIQPVISAWVAKHGTRAQGLREAAEVCRSLPERCGEWGAACRTCAQAIEARLK